MSAAHTHTHMVYIVYIVYMHTHWRQKHLRDRGIIYIALAPSRQLKSARLAYFVADQIHVQHMHMRWCFAAAIATAADEDEGMSGAAVSAQGYKMR